MNINIIVLFKELCSWLQFVLFGFRPNLASQFVRSPSNHSYGYVFSDDHTNCLASFALNPDKIAGSDFEHAQAWPEGWRAGRPESPFMQYAG